MKSTILILSILFALAACAPAATPTPAPTIAPTVAPTRVPPTPTVAPTVTPTTAPKRDLGKDVLAQNDGWAAQGTGTTGGSAAKPDHVYTVRNRKELIAALYDGTFPSASALATPSNAPKIIFVEGTIDLNVDDNNKSLTCQDYNRDGYTIQAFNTAFDPAVWGRKVVSGTLETARTTSQKAQEERVRVRIGSNTTLVGVGKSATIRGVWFDLRGTATAPVSNIIIRNLTFQDTFDCFPQWDPTDGADGNWNALYDSISLRFTDHVWVDHNTFEDRETADSKLAKYFGRLFQIHDGELDITNASDLVTVSWNRFLNHDKVSLIGSSDSGATATADRGKLRVTLHHNYFDNLGQRVPRVRFGQVHVYNNYYNIVNNPGFGYAWGVGVESQIYAENNYFKTDANVALDKIIGRYNGAAIYIASTRVNDKDVDLLGVHNAAFTSTLSSKVDWKPTLVTKVDPVETVVTSVESSAGPVNW